MTRLIIVGLGGIGSHLLLPLMQYLNYNKNSFERILFVDGDKYEEKNLNRQQVPDFINKAEAQVKQYRAMFDKMIITPVDVYVTPDNIASLLEDDDVVLLCVDNNKTRIMFEEHFENMDNLTVISGGNELQDGNVMIMQKKDKELLTPKFSELHPEIADGKDKRPDELSCLELSESAPQISIVNATIADKMRVTLYAMMNNKIKYYEIFINCLTGNIRMVKFEEPTKSLSIVVKKDD